MSALKKQSPHLKLALESGSTCSTIAVFMRRAELNIACFIVVALEELGQRSASAEAEILGRKLDNALTT